MTENDMPHFKTAFRSKFLNASEIDRPFEATIKLVDYQEVGTDDKPERKLVAIFHEEGTKAIVLNVSRCEAIAELAKTPDFDAWAGTRVQVSQGMTRFNGKKTPCIVISAPDLPF
jgi:hypothetical protein